MTNRDWRHARGYRHGADRSEVVLVADDRVQVPPRQLEVAWILS